MDPLTALIIAIWIAGRLTKNVYQDAVFKARGEDPPSFRREMARWEAKQARSANQSSDGPGRRFWANAWQDAVESADERRARVTEKAAERRRKKWTDADRDAAEAEARDINDRVPAPPVETWPCGGGCGRPLSKDDIAGYALSGDPLCRECRTTPQQPRHTDGTGAAGTSTPDRGERMVQCASCGYDFRATDTSWTNVDGATLAMCPPCRLERAEPQKEFPAPPECPPNAYDQGSAEPTTSTSEPAAEPQVRPVTDINEWRAKGSTPPITKEDIVSGETTTLSAALQYAQDMADQCGAGAASTETSIATMRSGGVEGDVLSHFTQAQDLLTQAMAAFNAGHAELQADMAVKDAYQARQGAGDKQFVTQD